MKHIWLYLSKGDVQTEKQQCLEEGRDLSTVRDLFSEVLSLDLEDRTNQPAAEALLDATIQLPMRVDYSYYEPSDLEGIRAARPAGVKLPSFTLNDSELEDKVYGAWTGRCVGCLLGKPVEGWQTEKMWGYLKDSGRYPLSDFFIYGVDADIRKKYELNEGACFGDKVDYMPEDDDTNYTTTGLAIMKRHGRDFTPEDVANFWMNEIPLFHVCTAERIAYRNFALLIAPPESATFRNPYREWIGAQIRADFWGYAAPGNPQLAAEFAWRDACISHVKNGIYGEMWAAAMIAAAFVTSDIPTIIRAGLAQVPENSRLAERVNQVLDWYSSGLDYDSAVTKLHTIWNEKTGHGWCHTISNAMIVAIALLWGEMDFAKSICRSVQPGFDTDCNGATVGSVMGIVSGRKAMPSYWADHIKDTLYTGVTGYHQVKLNDITRDSLEIIRKVNG